MIKKDQRKLKKIFIITAIIIIFVLLLDFLIPYQYNKAKKLRTLASTYVLLGQFTTALQKYKEAENQWPFFYYDKDFQSEIQTTLNVKKEYENRPSFIIFLKNSQIQNETDQFISKIELFPSVKKVVFVSQEEALKRYKQNFKKDPLLLEMITADILPSSIEVYTFDTSQEEELIKLAKDQPFAENVIPQHGNK